jgi:hypothetical protein
MIQQRGNAEHAIVTREADKRLLAAFINGLRGIPGKLVTNAR